VCAAAASEEVLSAGPDGRPRCWWATSTDDYVRYHDEEWGRPVTDDCAMYERITLEAFQSGLSWLTILRKREAFRTAFSGFDFDVVARFGDADIERLMGDAAIVRNRAKIEATIANAKAAAEMAAAGESLAALVWAHAPTDGSVPSSMDDVVSITPESKALAKELKRRGFRFVGPTTAYAAMEACGVVNDHFADCAVRDEVQREREAALRSMG
jgi:DNA-3-methyladenine glycosylase I